MLVNSNKSPGITIKEMINLLFNHFFPPSSNVNELIYAPNNERVEELSEKEVDLVMYNLKKDRKVVFVDGTVNTERQCFMGCQRGSVIVPGILELNNEELFVQTFASDLALTTGRTRRELEGNTNRLFALITDKLEEIKL
uniref:Uncharacterized protein n=1 Tax=Araneus ventricosus TaxID=182803 RepID=A0A4Y2WPX4_ARAVE|nr:hypothetical protein AVEN_3971-1 [Araneus ventricosus]